MAARRLNNIALLDGASVKTLSEQAHSPMWIGRVIGYSFGTSSLLSVQNPATDELRLRAAAVRQASLELCDSCRAVQVSSTSLPSRNTGLTTEAEAVVALQESVRCYATAWRLAAERPEAMLVDLKSVLNDGMAALPDDLKRSLSEQVISWSIGTYYSAPTGGSAREVKA